MANIRLRFCVWRYMKKEIWRRLGMVFKPSFKCFKKEIINFGLSILKLETLLYQNIFISFHHILYIYISI